MVRLYQNVLLITIFTVALPCVMSECKPGTIKSKADNEEGFICEPCYEGTFSDKPDQTKCENCWHVDDHDPYLRVVSECEPDHDTIVECKQPNSFVVKEHKTCKLCTRCEDFGLSTVQPCKGFNNTVCGPKNDTDSRDEKSNDMNKSPTTISPGTSYTTNDYNHINDKGITERSCIHPDSLSWIQKERALFCNDDEDKVGESCTGKAYVICEKYGWSGMFALAINALIVICPIFIAVLCMNPVWTKFVSKVFQGIYRAIVRNKNRRH